MEYFQYKVQPFMTAPPLKNHMKSRLVVIRSPTGLTDSLDVETVTKVSLLRYSSGNVLSVWSLPKREQ